VGYGRARIRESIERERVALFPALAQTPLITGKTCRCAAPLLLCDRNTKPSPLHLSTQGTKYGHRELTDRAGKDHRKMI